ncbi:MAG: hypothetical protein GF350_05725, partial [Chitinivibrionales bacterium]|nr:hypothetical protein [Chitinivibrionales bacterium]
MAVVTWGTAHILAGTLGGRACPVLKIDNHRAVICYVKMVGGNQVAYACVVDVDPTTGNFTTYAEAEFCADTTAIGDALWACLLSSTSFYVGYSNNADGDTVYGRVGNISGTTITFGAETRTLNFSSRYQKCAALDSTHVLVAAEREDFPNEGKGDARVVEVSGDMIINLGGQVQFQTDRWTPWGLYPYIISLTSSTAIISYVDMLGLSGKVYVYYLTIAGNTITLESNALWDADESENLKGIRLTNSRFLSMWYDIANTQEEICVGTAPTTQGPIS